MSQYKSALSKYGLLLQQCLVQKCHSTKKFGTEVSWYKSVWSGKFESSPPQIMPFKSPLPNVPLETEPYGLRMLDVFWRHGVANPTKKAMICAENPSFSVTYHELYCRSLSVAAFLEKEGFKRGDVLLTVLSNSWEICEIMVGAALRGITLSGVNPQYKTHEIVQQIHDSGATLIFCEDETLEKALEAVEITKKIKKLVAIQLSDRTQELPADLPESVIRYNTVLATKPDTVSPSVEIDVTKDVLILPYSSGTTGPPKGVMISHQMFSTMVTIISDHVVNHIYKNLNPYREVASEAVLFDLPFCHIYGIAMVQKAMVLGQTAVLMHHFEKHCYLRSIQNFKVHYLYLKPPIIVMLANDPDVDAYDLSSVEGALSSGAPASVDVCNKAFNRLPNFRRIDQGFGMTETSGACSLPWLDSTRAVTAHSGILLPNLEIRTIGPDGNEVPPNEGGELLLRSPCMMLGYIGRPEETAKAYHNGWLRTGDFARVDEKGFVYIIDRLKDIMKIQGFQVSPSELEDVLLSHPDIVDAAIIAIPFVELGEAPYAYIVTKNPALTKAAIHEHVNTRVSEFKQLVGGIEFIDAIPKSDTGKILKNVLRDMYAESVKNSF